MNEQATTPRKPLHAERGFTLIGIIIALAIAGILAAAIIPRTMNSALDEIRRAEDQNLAAIKANIRAYVEANHRIPGAATWTADIATYADLPSSQLKENQMKGSRYYVYPNTFPLPFDQSQNWIVGQQGAQTPSPLPIDPYIMIISNLDPTKPLINTLGINITPYGQAIQQTQFINIRNQSRQFTNSNPDIRIETINLADLFVPVDFTIYGGTAAQASFKTDGSPAVTINAQADPYTVRYYFIRGTRLDLFASANAVSPQISDAIYNPASYSYSWNNATGTGTWYSQGSGGVGGGGGGGAGGGANQFLTSNQQNGQTVYTANWAPQQGCTSTGSFPLKVTNNNQTIKYNFYAYDPNTGTGVYIDKVNPNTPNKILKKTIAGCALVLGAPENKTGVPSLLLFYMPNAAYSVIVN